MTLEYVNYIMWVPWPLGIFVYYSYIQSDFGKLGGNYTPNIMCMNYYSSLQYYQETMFIPISFLVNLINSINIIENTNAIPKILTIQTNTIHDAYRRQYLPIFYVFPLEGK